MHNLLRLEKLSSLPYSSRRIAQSAAKGSLPDLIRLMTLFDGASEMATFAGCLPVLYANLDPAGIPTGDNLFTRPVQKACIALEGFRYVDGSYNGAGIDLWQRVWPWLTFLNTHRDALPESLVSQMNFDPLFFIFCLGDDEETTFTMHQSPALYFFVADRWTSLLEANVDDELVSFAYLGHFLNSMDAHHNPANLLELVEATNGPHGFASLVVRTLSLFIPDQGTRMTADVVHFYTVFASSLLDVAMADSVEGTSGVDILSALVSAGTIGLVTNMIRAIGESSASEEEFERDQLLEAFELLDRLLEKGSYEGMAEALAAGLLPAIIRTSIICKDTDDFDTTSLYGIVIDMLPGALVYHTVVAPLESQLLEAEPLASDPTFKASPMYKGWPYFSQLGWDRIRLLKEAEEGRWRREWACNNIACGAMQDKSDFRRCSNCQRAYYCSSACQRQDWKDGGHREVCRQLRISMFSLSSNSCKGIHSDLLNTPIENSDLGSRNVSFMRAILERYTFPNEDEKMVRAHLALARSHPNQLTIHVQDCKFGDPSDELCLLDDVRPKDDGTDEDVCWDAHIARVARSGGLITLHLMLFWDGERTRRWLFATRRENPTLQRGLTRILEEVPSSADPKDAIEELVDDLEFEYDTHSTFQ
ncbi:hypothetical protein C8R46DRAFT_1352704 [Mycena filopes]|nr:hypothetical protein C8R46DRAFT_1352704 [Mycena filopes]